MDPNTAIHLLETLADGVDPATGEVLSIGHCLQRASSARALGLAIEALRLRTLNAQRRKNLPPQSGKAWESDEEKRLTNLFDDGTDIPAIAKELGRTRGAVRARLVKLGRLDPEPRLAERFHRGSARMNPAA